MDERDEDDLVEVLCDTEEETDEELDEEETAFFGIQIGALPMRTMRRFRRSSALDRHARNEADGALDAQELWLIRSVRISTNRESVRIGRNHRAFLRILNVCLQKKSKDFCT